MNAQRETRNTTNTRTYRMVMLNSCCFGARRRRRSSPRDRISHCMKPRVCCATHSRAAPAATAQTNKRPHKHTHTTNIQRVSGLINNATHDVHVQTLASQRQSANVIKHCRAISDRRRQESVTQARPMRAATRSARGCVALPVLLLSSPLHGGCPTRANGE